MLFLGSNQPFFLLLNFFSADTVSFVVPGSYAAVVHNSSSALQAFDFSKACSHSVLKSNLAKEIILAVLNKANAAKLHKES